MLTELEVNLKSHIVAASSTSVFVFLSYACSAFEYFLAQDILQNWNAWFS